MEKTKNTIVIADEGSMAVKGKIFGSEEHVLVASSLVEGYVDDEDLTDVFSWSEEGRKPKIYTVSESARESYTDDPEYQYSRYNAILTQQMFRKLGLNGEKIELHVTLPIADFYKNNKENIEKKQNAMIQNAQNVVFQGKGFQACQIEKVHVHPEGIPQVIDVFYHVEKKKVERVKEYKNIDTVLVLDVGGYTIDCCLATLEDQKPVFFKKEEKIMSIKDSGLLKMKKELEKLLVEKFDTKVFLSRKKFDEIIDKKVYRDEKINREIEEAAENTFEPALHQINQKYVLDEPEAVLLVGGGANFIEKLIAKKFPNAKIIIPNDPHLSLIRGIEKITKSKN